MFNYKFTSIHIHCCFIILVNLNTSFPCFTSTCVEALVCHDQYLVKQATFHNDGISPNIYTYIYIRTVGLHIILVRTSASACVEGIISAEFAGVILNQ